MDSKQYRSDKSISKCNKFRGCLPSVNHLIILCCSRIYGKNAKHKESKSDMFGATKV